MRAPLPAAAGALLLLGAVFAADERPPMAKRLDDPDWVVRALTAKSIGDTKYSWGIQWMRDRLAKEKSEYARAFLLRSLRAFPLSDLARVGGKGLVPAAMSCLDARSGRVRDHAGKLLETLTAQKLGEDLKAWKAWWAGAEAGFEFPKEPEPKAGAPAAAGPEEAKTHKTTTFEEFVYESRRKGLEVVFVLDQTSSMQPTIDTAKANILEICEYVQLLVPKYRLGLVTYDDAVQAVLPLTKDYESVQARLSKVSAVGGGDPEEGVDKGLKAAAEAKLGWSKEARKVLVVLGDAPPHPADQAPTEAFAAEIAKQGWTVNAINVNRFPQTTASFTKIAKAGGGSAAQAEGGGTALVQEMLILSLGEEHRQALSGFVDEIRLVRDSSPGKKVR